MQKPFIILSIFLILVSVLVYSCSTKDDPPVPNHTSNTTTGGNTVTFGLFSYYLGYRSCPIDTTYGKHYAMLGKDVNSGFAIGVLFYDSVAPTATSTYSVVSNPILSSGQCYIELLAPLVSPSKYIATSGNLNYNPGGGNPTLTISNVPVMNLSDSTNTSTISGSWSCQ